MEAVRQARQQLQGFLLRHGRVFAGRKAWTLAHRRWLAGCDSSTRRSRSFSRTISRHRRAERRRRLEEQIAAGAELVAGAGGRPCRRCAASPSLSR